MMSDPTIPYWERPENAKRHTRADPKKLYRKNRPSKLIGNTQSRAAARRLRQMKNRQERDV